MAQEESFHAELDEQAGSGPTESWIGKTVGRFKLIGLLGRGSMGVVYHAQDVTLKREVALKVLPERIEMGERSEKVEQFIREARSAAALEHPNVVHIYEVGRHSGWFFIAMELVEGGSLEQLVKAAGPMDYARACQVTAESAEALAAAHKLGIIHRDIKPANLMLTRSGRCKVTDFGLARHHDPSDPFRLSTETVGTPLYIAPEVTMGKPATAASDIYSLGATLWHLLTGRPVFIAKTRKEILQMVREQPVPDLSKIRKDLPPNLVATIYKCLAKDPAKRFQDADQLAKVLRAHTVQLAGGSNVYVGSSSQMGSAAMSMVMDDRGKPRAWLIWAVLGILSAIVLGVVIIVVVVLMSRQPPASPADKSKTTRQEVEHPQTPVTPSPPQNAQTPVTPAPPANNPPVAVEPKPPEPAAVAPTTQTAQAEPPKVEPPKVEPPKEEPPKVEPPKVEPPPVVTATQPAPPAAPGTVAATDTEALKAITAKKDVSVHTVTGTVSTVQPSQTGSVIRINFEGVGAGGFYCAYFRDRYGRIHAAFGPNCAKLVGKKVLVKGKVEDYRGSPQIIIDDPAQITIAP